MDQISRRLTHKVLPVQSRQRVIVINHRPACGCEPSVRFAFRRPYRDL
jgi:hypothetical protein